MQFIGQKGLLVILGVRINNKSSLDLPPKREKLVCEFNKPFSVKSKLTVGARAVTKHSDRHRGNFWGVITGTEENRNKNSNLICLDIVANAAWISVFNLSSNLKIVEIRSEEGHGIRWEYHGMKNACFKGLVEPQWKREKINKENEIIGEEKCIDSASSAASENDE